MITDLDQPWTDPFSVRTRISETDAKLFAKILNGITDFGRGSEQSSMMDHSHDNIYYQYIVALVCGLLGNKIIWNGSNCITVKFEFLIPIQPEDEITTTITITGIDRVKRLTKVQIDCVNQAACQVITGQAVLLNAS